MNRNIKFKVFKENDWVLMYNSSLGKYHKKLKLRYGGPYRIIRVLLEGTFLLSDRYGNLLPKLVNGFRLKTYLDEDPMKIETSS